MKIEKSIALRFLNANRYIELDDLDMTGSDSIKTCHSVFLFKEIKDATNMVNRIKLQYKSIKIEPPKIEVCIVEPKTTEPPEQWRKWSPLPS